MYVHIFFHIGSLVLYILHIPKTNMVHKCRGDYFKAAIPMMPEENKAIASFSLDNF